MFRRPILLFLYSQILIILVLYYTNPFNLGRLLDKKSSYTSIEEGTVVSVVGVAEKVQIKDYYSAIYVNTGTEKVLVRVKNFLDEEKLYDLCGRNVSIKGELSFPSGRRNPNCFDYKLYLKGQGVYSIVDASIYRIRANTVKMPLLHVLSKAKASFYLKVKPLLSDESFSIMAGLLFGDKAYMEDELYESFQTNGIAHVLAVSGLHVGLMYSIIERLFKGRKNVLTTVITAVLLYCYIVLSSYSISVIRACFMILLKLLAFHLRRRYDSVCSIAFTAIVFLLYNPYQLFDSGFQLSFAAAITIALTLPWIESKALHISRKKKSNLCYDMVMLIAPSLAIHIGTAPLIAFHFLNYSLVSLILNPFAIALSGIILPIGLLLFTISILNLPVLSTLVAILEDVLCQTLKLVNTLGLKSNLSCSSPAPSFGILIIFYIFFFYFFSESRYRLNRKKEELSLAKIALALCLCTAFFPFLLGITQNLLPWSYNTAKITFVDVGQGDCTHICLDGYNILIDGGGGYNKNVGKDTLKPYLLKNGITKIDLAIVTHKDQDHSKGIYELNECFDIEKIFVAGNDNDDCGIAKVSIDGVDILLMADADQKREAKLLEDYPNISADIIKLAHHGSKNSSGDQFLLNVSPSFAMISCGKNNSYGHPGKRVIELLQNLGIIYGRSDYDGAISLIKVTDDYAILANAARNKYWHIPKNK